MLRDIRGKNADSHASPGTENLNQWYQSGDQAFILISACLVLLMVPGIAFLYSGLARRKSALSMLWVVMMSFSVIVFQWYFWGYSLAFGQTSGNGFIGDLKHFGLMKVWATPSVGSPLIPALLYSFYQMLFCAVTAALTIGAVAERGRVVPAMVFTFFWATLVYCPLAYWVWNSNGWLFKHGVFDYAGGVPVEIGSGVSALAYSWVLGRRNDKMMMNFRPHNISLITLGTILLWFGWLGFNGGSSFGANLRAVMACWNSCLTATFAAMTWCLLDYRLAKKWSMVGWCSGTISGLVAATPASGFIDPWASIALGVVAGVACNFGTKSEFLLIARSYLCFSADVPSQSNSSSASTTPSTSSPSTASAASLVSSSTASSPLAASSAWTASTPAPPAASLTATLPPLAGRLPPSSPPAPTPSSCPLSSPRSSTSSPA